MRTSFGFYLMVKSELRKSVVKLIRIFGYAWVMPQNIRQYYDADEHSCQA